MADPPSSDDPTDAVPAPAGTAPWRRALRFGLGLALGGAAIWVVVTASGGISDALDALKKVDWWWLLPAAPAEQFSSQVPPLPNPAQHA